MEYVKIAYLCDKLDVPRTTDVSELANILGMRYNLVGSVVSIINQSITKLRGKQDPIYIKLKKDMQKGILRREKIKKHSKYIPDKKWRQLRKRVLSHFGTKCMRCGIRPEDKKDVHVDHIKPKSKHPDLEFDITNLQVLCKECNEHKSNVYIQDFRTEAQKELMLGLSKKSGSKNKIEKTALSKTENKDSSLVFTQFCRVCNNSFYPLQTLEWRAEGYCKVECYRKRFNKKYKGG